MSFKKDKPCPPKGTWKGKGQKIFSILVPKIKINWTVRVTGKSTVIYRFILLKKVSFNSYNNGLNKSTQG